MIGILYLLGSVIVLIILIIILAVLEEKTLSLERRILYKQLMLGLIAIEAVVVWLIIKIFSV